MMARHLMIMVKAPRLGQVKRRLAADIGDVAACWFYRRSTTTLLRRLAHDARWQTWLALTPDRFAAKGRWWPATRRIPQGGGDLGRRMATLLRHPPPGPVVIVGSDIPDIAPRHIDTAFKALGDHDLVFGPAEDGGYWLVGARRRPHLPDPFRGVRWSTERALADSLANIEGRYSVALLDELQDIDDGAALARWRAGQSSTMP